MGESVYCMGRAGGKRGAARHRKLFWKMDKNQKEEGHPRSLTFQLEEEEKKKRKRENGTIPGRNISFLFHGYNHVGSSSKTVQICLTFYPPPCYIFSNFPRLNCIIHETFDSSSTGRNDIFPFFFFFSQMCAVKVVFFPFPNSFFFFSMVLGEGWKKKGLWSAAGIRFVDILNGNWYGLAFYNHVFLIRPSNELEQIKYDRSRGSAVLIVAVSHCRPRLYFVLFL